MNATLAMIRTPAQLYFMTTLNITSNTWIGLTDSAQEGNWRWNNGDTVNVTNWGLNQPDGGFLENCTVMNVSDTYRWHDQSCSSINDYVCERGKVTLNFLTILKENLLIGRTTFIFIAFSMKIYFSFIASSHINKT